MIRRPPRSTLFPTRRSSDLDRQAATKAFGRYLEGTTFTVDQIRFINSMVDELTDRKSTRLNSSHVEISYAVFCLKKKTNIHQHLLLHYINNCISSIISLSIN